MGELLNRLAEVDPEFARSLRRNQILSYIFAAVALLAIGGAVWAVGVNFNQGSAITRIQHSACQAEPAGRECQLAKRESSRAANLATTCISFWKAGYPCPKPGSTAAERQGRRQEVQANSKEVQGLEAGGGSDGPRSKPDVTEHLTPSEPGAGATPPPHKPPSKAPETPPPSDTTPPPTSAPTTVAPPAQSSTEPGPATPAPETSEPEPPALLNPVLETVCSVVGRVAHLC